MSAKAAVPLGRQVGDRVFFYADHGLETGTILFRGPTHWASGEWFGLELNNEVGSTDGTIDGKVYFRCAPGHGVFCREQRLGARVLKWRMLPSSPVRGGGSGPPSPSKAPPEEDEEALPRPAPAPPEERVRLRTAGTVQTSSSRQPYLPPKSASPVSRSTSRSLTPQPSQAPPESFPDEDELQVLRMDLEEVTAELHAARAEAAAFKEECGQARARTERLEREVQELREQLKQAAQAPPSGTQRTSVADVPGAEALQRELEEARRSQQALQRELEEARRSQQAQEQELEAVRRSQQGLERELAEARRNVQALERELAEGRRNLQASERRQEQAIQDIQRASQASERSHEQALHESAMASEALARDLSEARGNLQASERRLAELQEELRQARAGASQAVQAEAQVKAALEAVERKHAEEMATMTKASEAELAEFRKGNEAALKLVQQQAQQQIVEMKQVHEAELASVKRAEAEAQAERDAARNALTAAQALAKCERTAREDAVAAKKAQQDTIDALKKEHEEALAQARQAKSGTKDPVAEAKAAHQEELEKLKKAHEEALAKARKANEEELERTKRAHEEEVAKLKKEHEATASSIAFADRAAFGATWPQRRPGGAEAPDATSSEWPTTRLPAPSRLVTQEVAGAGFPQDQKWIVLQNMDIIDHERDVEAMSVDDKTTIADIRRRVEEQGYSGFTVCRNMACLKKFDRQLRTADLSPSEGKRTFHLYFPDGVPPSEVPATSLKRTNSDCPSLGDPDQAHGDHGSIKDSRRTTIEAEELMAVLEVAGSGRVSPKQMADALEKGVIEGNLEAADAAMHEHETGGWPGCT